MGLIHGSAALKLPKGTAALKKSPRKKPFPRIAPEEGLLLTRPPARPFQARPVGNRTQAAWSVSSSLIWTGPESWPFASTSRSTSSITPIGAASP